ncbi:hypothetical protein [Bradyrhizobium iriomotense]|uniref:hypothetical protein n=1 Tax=Bradyrhizobium iriomotense TaxID=441950 RepID=UPI0024E114B6|nr:hypothetical protein [Bradyrhizobium iriomotense]
MHHHVTHTHSALRILEDGKINRRLIYDECSLNDSRTTVVWLSPNQWYWGSRYGSVEFTYDFKDLVKGRKIHWLEVQTGYRPHACRFLITDQDVKHLPVQLYDADREEGPLRHVDGVWHWNDTHTGEFLLESNLWLGDCRKVDFIKHHAQLCAIGGCAEQGKDGDGAAGRVIAYILSRGSTAIDKPLIVTDPKKALSSGVERGLSHVRMALGAISKKLNGPLKSAASVDPILHAALLQYALGERKAANQTTALIGSDELFRERLSTMVEAHFDLKSESLSS